MLKIPERRSRDDDSSIGSSVDSSHPEFIVCAGFLLKKGLIVHNWKKRYFCLKNKLELTYHERNLKGSDKDRNSGGYYIPGDLNPLGVINLKNALYVASGKDSEGSYEFQLLCQDRLWEFIASTQDERQFWIDSINSLLPDVKCNIESRFEGWIVKQGRMVKNWKKRWFMIGKIAMFYFLNQENCDKFKRCSVEMNSLNDLTPYSKELILGMIPLHGCSVVDVGDYEGRSHTFSLEAQDRTYYFVVVDEEMAKNWIKYIKEAINMAALGSAELRALQEPDTPVIPVGLYAVTPAVPKFGIPLAVIDEQQPTDGAPTEFYMSQPLNSTKSDNSNNLSNDAIKRRSCSMISIISKNSDSNNGLNSPNKIEKDWIIECKQGHNFVKYGRFGKPHKRNVRLDFENGVIDWESDSIFIKDIVSVSIGAKTSVLQNSDCIKARCFSFITASRTLDLQCDSPEERNYWVSNIQIYFQKYLPNVLVDDGE